MKYKNQKYKLYGLRFILKKYIMDNFTIILLQYITSILIFGIVAGMIYDIKGLIENSTLNQLIYTYDIDVDGNNEFNSLLDTFNEQDISQVEYYTVGGTYEDFSNYGIVFEKKYDFFNSLASSNLKIISGRNFYQQELENGDRVIVINISYLKEYYPESDIGNVIEISGNEYKIIGICNDMDGGCDIYIPYNNIYKKSDKLQVRQAVIRFTHIPDKAQKKVLKSMSQAKQLIYSNIDILIGYLKDIFVICINIILLVTITIYLNKISRENYSKVYDIYNILNISQRYISISKLIISIIVSAMAVFSAYPLYKLLEFLYIYIMK